MTENGIRERICCSDRRNTLAAGTDRLSFCCLEVNIPKKSRFMERAYARVRETLPHLNRGQANTSAVRDKVTVESDNCLGIIAELACLEVLNWRYGKEKELFRSSESNTSLNQIDIRLFNGKTMEVRSSCVRNGLDFALFAVDRQNPGKQYFDVIGPYSNGYKPGELLKDYYMRVLYECRKEDFRKLLADEQPYLRLYITGGATAEMMQNENIYQIKHLLPSRGQVDRESDYRVIPLSRSLDIREFFCMLEMENGLQPCHPLCGGERL